MNVMNGPARGRWISCVLAVLLAISFQMSATAQIVLNEIRSDGGSDFTVELKNQGASTVNIGGYFLCSFPAYSPILSLSVECGSLSLGAGEIVVVSGFEGGTAADGELGLYLNGSFANPASILDYVEWGSSGHQRSSVAQAAGIWSASDFVAAFNDGESIEYSGSGNTSASWEVEAIVQSLCLENPPGENCTITAATINTTDPTDVCSGDGIGDFIDVSVSGELGNNEAWLITDTAGLILDVPAGPPFNFEGADEGTCLIWHVIYNGDITGVQTGLNANDITGCFELSNPIEINRREIAGGTISTSDPTVICAGDTIPDPIDVSLTDTIGDSSAWVITDTLFNILDLPAAPPFDLNDAGPGTCVIWHMSYNTGLSGLMTGQNVNDLTGCYHLSNPIVVVRNEPDGGSISTLNTDVCLVEANSDTVFVNLSNERGNNSAWIVTDTSGNILELPAGPAFTFSGDAGVCQIWHINYEDGISGLQVGMNASGIAGCFDLSNSITITKYNPEAGTISTSDETTFCIGLNDGDTVHVDLTANSGGSFQWVVIDADGDIVGLPDSSVISFDNFGQGSYEIVHVSYVEGLSGLMIGQPLSGLNGCFELSNSITVTRNLVIGGAITTSDETALCLLGGATDTVDVQLVGNFGGNSAWLITDTAGVILSLPSAPPFTFSDDDRTCHIWHISYEEGLSGLEIGMNAAELSGCFDLSNAITVVKNNPDGGVISTSDNTIFCIHSNEGDTVNVDLEGAVGANTQWMIVEFGGTILDLPAGPPFSFASYDAGEYVIFHLSYADGLTGLSIGNTTADLVGCWAVSNPIVVERLEPLGGVISPISDTDLCAPAGMPQPFQIDISDASGENSFFLITDTLLNIVDTSNGLPVQLEISSEQPLLIWNLSYAGDITGAEIGSNAANISGCFELSNSITVNPVYLDAGMILPIGSTSFCADDTIPDIIDALVEGAFGPNLTWMIIDEDRTILDLPAAPPFDFTTYLTGTYRIFYVAYADDATGLEVGMSAANLSGCLMTTFDPIIVYKEYSPISGTASLTDSSAITEFCTGDGLADTVRFTVEGDTSQNGAWVVVDEQGNIQAVATEMPIDFEGVGSGSGTCMVMYLAYQGEISGLAAGSNTEDLSGCFALSNAIEVVCRRVDGGIINTNDDLQVCVGDSLPDVINVDLEGEIGSNSSWVLTDEGGAILDLSSTPPFDFDDSDAGTCLIWHLSYEEGLAGAEVGMNAADLSGCFNLSNSLTVAKFTGGTVCQNVGVLDNVNDYIKFDIYPNPVRNSMRFEVVFKEVQEELKIEIFDLLGVAIYRADYIDRIALAEELNLSGIPAGQYILKLNSAVRPFIKLD